MKKVKVTVVKLAGETGLRQPGSTLLMNEPMAQSLASKGIVKLPEKRKTTKKDVAD